MHNVSKNRRREFKGFLHHKSHYPTHIVEFTDYQIIISFDIQVHFGDLHRPPLYARDDLSKTFHVWSISHLHSYQK
jgi:hypothetical protein